MKKSLLLALLIPGLSFAKTFSVAFQTMEKDIPYSKARAELQIMRSGKICKEDAVAFRAIDWRCRLVARKKHKCAANFRCEALNNGVKKEKEMRRLAIRLQKLPIADEKVKLVISTKSPGEILATPAFLAYPKKRVKTVQGSFDYQELKSSEIVIAKKEVNVQKAYKDENVFYIKDPSEIAKEENSETWLLQSKGEVDSDKKYTLIKKADKKEQGYLGKKKDWWNFSFSYLSSSDDNNNSLSTFNLSYSPFYWFNRTFGLRGQAGGHFYETKNNLEEIESFLIMEFGVNGLVRFERLYFEAGLGIQKWNDSAGEMYSYYNMGVGYKFKKYFLKHIDRVFFNFNNVGTTTSTTEMRLGLGLSF